LKKLAKLIICFLLAGCGRTDYPEPLAGSSHEWHRTESGNVAVYLTNQSADINMEQIEQVAYEVAEKIPSGSSGDSSQ